MEPVANLRRARDIVHHALHEAVVYSVLHLYITTVSPINGISYNMINVTRIRLEDTQVCPAFLNLDATRERAATSMSASSNTIKGAFPPSSRDTCTHKDTF